MISSQFQSLWNSQPPSNNISRHLLVKSDVLLICVGKNFSLRWETGELWGRSWQKKKSGYVRRTSSVINHQPLFQFGTSQGLCSTLRVGVYLTNIGIIVAIKIDLGYWPTKADKLSPLLWSQRQKKKTTRNLWSRSRHERWEQTDLHISVVEAWISEKYVNQKHRGQ